MPTIKNTKEKRRKVNSKSSIVPLSPADIHFFNSMGHKNQGLVEILKELDLPTTITKDGFLGIPTYLKDAYNIEINENDYTLFRNLEVEVTAPYVIQNGIELGRMKRMCELSKEKYLELLKKEPIELIAMRGRSYLVNGNHRLLLFYIGNETIINGNVWSITNPEKADILKEGLFMQSMAVRDKFQDNNVIALRNSLEQQLKEYRQ